MDEMALSEGVVKARAVVYLLPEVEVELLRVGEETT
jgi:hypothetical protein